MASSLLPLSLRNTLAYFAKYNYVLTSEELWYWQHGSSYSLAQVKKAYPKKLSRSRILKEKISKNKWQTAFAAGERLSKISSILAVFVTGSLSMNNVVSHDDIDLMIIVAPNTLWLTRLWVNIIFWTTRRKPNTKKANNKICPNLWLDTNNLHIKNHDIYRAHEVLQAKLLWERTSIQQEFLKQNKWVEKYLSVAYKTQTKKYKFTKISTNSILYLFNALAFMVQYIYMHSKMTNEKVGLGYAFFHPKT